MTIDTRTSKNMFKALLPPFNTLAKQLIINKISAFYHLIDVQVSSPACL